MNSEDFEIVDLEDLYEVGIPKGNLKDSDFEIYNM